MTIGKTLGAGIPSAAYGMTEQVQRRIVDGVDPDVIDVGGTGGTLAGNALSLAAMRATLGRVLTDDAFDRMIAIGERFEDGVRDVISSRGLPWHVVRLGCRVEYLFRPDAARTGAEAALGQDGELDPFIHLYLLNRGILMTPFHNMALMSPSTSEEDADRHTEVFAAAADELLGNRRPRVIGRVSFLTIDANDPARLAAFWGELLGTAVEETSDEGRFVFLAAANGHILSFQRVPEPKSVKNRVHLDLRVEDLEAATNAVLASAAPGTGTSGPSTRRGGARSATRRATSSTSS